MNIEKISTTPAIFGAKTKVNAPITMLSRKDKKFFEAWGSRIGTDSDTIELTISSPIKNKKDTKVKFYAFTEDTTFTKNEKVGTCSTKLIPYITSCGKNPLAIPKVFLTRIFENIEQDYNSL